MLETARARKGYIKVRLHYETQKPRHIRSLLVRESLGIAGPYFENVSVLVPQTTAYPLLEAFLPAFNVLKDESVVGKEDVLHEFVFLDEDVVTQAYMIG